MKNYLITGSPTQPDFGIEKIRLENVMEMLKNESVLAVDSETQGLSHIDDQMLMLQISTPTANFIIDTQTTNISGLKDIFLSKEVVKIFHNASFDIRFLKASGIEVENVWDTMLIEQSIHLGTDLSCSLKDTLHRHKGIEMDKEVRSSFIGHSGDFSKDQILYASADTEYLIEIRANQMEEVERLELEEVANLENKAVLAFADCTYQGLRLDQPEWMLIAKESEKLVEIIRQELNQYLKDGFLPTEVKFDLFGEPEFNWNSPKQVLDIFQCLIPDLESVGRPVLAPFRKDHEIIDKYISYKEASKRANAYGVKFIKKYLHSDGKIHPNFRQIVSTGRTSSSSPNCQQLPQEGGFRECFKPDRGWDFISCDYSSQEVVLAAYFSKEPVFLDAIRNGKDLHSMSASKVHGSRFDDEQDPALKKKLRNMTKAVTFLLLFGGGAYTLSNRLEISEEEAEELIDLYFEAFPRLKVFLDRIGEYGTTNGIIRSGKPFRRRRVFDQWNGELTSRGDLGRIDRQSRNYIVQSSASDMTKQAMINVREAVKNSNGRAKMVFAIHDEICCITKSDYSEEFRNILEKCMTDAGDMIVEPGLIKAEAQISRTWTK